MLDDSFKQRIRLGRLYDVYGPLLTAKQQSCMELYFCDDLSLAEIAAELDVSRQAVHDLIHRVEQILERYETKNEASGTRGKTAAVAHGGMQAA